MSSFEKEFEGVQIHPGEEPRGEETFLDKLTKFNNDNPGLVVFLETAKTWSTFADSLLGSIAKYGSLTPKQLEAAKKMQATVEQRNRERAATLLNMNPPAETAPILYARLASAFLSSSEHLQHPKLRLVTEATTLIPVVLSRCGNMSRTPGHINITDGEPYGANRYFGRITPEGQVFFRQDCPEAVKALLTEFDGHPVEAIRAQGVRTGKCCCCGRTLTDPESIASGIGPVCAEQWGF